MFPRSDDRQNASPGWQDRPPPPGRRSACDTSQPARGVRPPRRRVPDRGRLIARHASAGARTASSPRPGPRTPPRQGAGRGATSSARASRACSVRRLARAALGAGPTALSTPRRRTVAAGRADPRGAPGARGDPRRPRRGHRPPGPRPHPPGHRAGNAGGRRRGRPPGGGRPLATRGPPPRDPPALGTGDAHGHHRSPPGRAHRRRRRRHGARRHSLAGAEGGRDPRPPHGGAARSAARPGRGPVAGGAAAPAGHGVVRPGGLGRAHLSSPGPPRGHRCR